uniref:Sulfatase N-terminal domain-containing protein n=1 Tax=Haptolina brevifila TaxID=156173 RepID=A0A7S2BUN3_9EUKA|mmetsp:Transcript_16828/g.33946  ORF Transcript_16828/g.33946 Transcript_16828/m.33946 type:complete len:231 (+) Transcript_16828:189-881(+)
MLEIGPIDSIDAWDAMVATAAGTQRTSNGKSAAGEEEVAEITPPRAEVLLAGIDIDKRGAALRVGRYKLLVGSWGTDTWCDLNVSGHSPDYPAPPAHSSLGGEGGIVCMHLPPALSPPPTSSPSSSPTRYGVKRQPSTTGGTVEDLQIGPPPPSPPWWDRVTALYDVKSDPREMHDLQHDLPEVVRSLLHKLVAYNSTVVPSIHKPSDPAGRDHANRTDCIGPWQGVPTW